MGFSGWSPGSNYCRPVQWHCPPEIGGGVRRVIEQVRLTGGARIEHAIRIVHLLEIDIVSRPGVPGTADQTQRHRFRRTARNAADVAVGIMGLGHRRLQSFQCAGVGRWIGVGILKHAGLAALNLHAGEQGAYAVGQVVISRDLICPR